MPQKKKVTRSTKTKKRSAAVKPQRFSKILLLFVALASTVGLGAYLLFFTSHAATTYTNGKIVFVGRSGNSAPQIYIAEQDGSNAKQVTKLTDQYGPMYPSISPDSRRIAYSHACNTGYSVCLSVINTDGSGNRQVFMRAPGAGPTYISWTPDSKQIIYNEGAIGGSGSVAHYHIKVVNADGTGDRMIYNGYNNGLWLPGTLPRVSPDGKYIAFVTGNMYELKAYLYVIDTATGGNKTELFTQSVFGSDLSVIGWSPDGKEVIYNRYNRGSYKNEIHSADVSTKVIRKRFEIPMVGNMQNPAALSADGKELIFTHLADHKIHRINFDGSNLREWKPANLPITYVSYVDWGKVAVAPPPPTPTPVATPTPPAPKPKPKAIAVAPAPQLPTTNELGAPVNLMAISEQSHVQLRWEAPINASADLKYSVERSADKTTWEVLQTNVSEQAYEDQTAKYGTEYTYRVKAQRPSGEASPFSEVKAAVTSFESNVKTNENVSITSEDGVVSITIPAGSLTSDAACSIIMLSADGAAGNVLQKYELSCKNSGGDPVGSFNQSVNGNIYPNIRWAGTHTKFKASTTVGADEPQLVTYDKKAKSFSFSADKPMVIAVSGNVKKGIPVLPLVLTVTGLTVVVGFIVRKLILNGQISSKLSSYRSQERGY